MATFNRPRNRHFCKGYLFALADIGKRFNSIAAHGTVLCCANREIGFLDEQTIRETFAGEMLEIQGSAEAWADLAAFCTEAQIGWSKELFDSWLILRLKLAEAHMKAQSH